jgi:hypothetical protein
MAQIKDFQQGADGDGLTVSTLTVGDGSAAAPSITNTGDTNTGVFFPAADTIGLATGGVEAARVASNGQLSAVVPGGTTLYPSFTARAWVNFNGTGTVAILSSGNVSSITDAGVGFYRVNLTTAMPDVNYSPMASGNLFAISLYGLFTPQVTNSSQYSISSTDYDVSKDAAEIYSAVFR